jgi:hypothetical protein
MEHRKRIYFFQRGYIIEPLPDAYGHYHCARYIIIILNKESQRRLVTHIQLTYP